MAIYYVDPSWTGTASGTQAQPYTSLSPITAASGDFIYLKRGTVLRQQITGAMINASNMTIGAYGTGKRPVVCGSEVVSSWTYDATNGVYFTSLGSNIGGNVAENGTPLKMVAWSTNIATTAPTIPVGGFAFDPVGFVLYIKPINGAVANRTFEVSQRLYCLNSNGTYTNLTINGIEFRGASRHGIVLTNRSGVRISDCFFATVGGYYEPSISTRLGNGVELGEGCNDAIVEKCVFEDIFDTAGTTQLYKTSAATISGHQWLNNVMRRCRLAGIEISAQTANQTITDVIVDGNKISDMGQGWSGALSNCAGINLTNNGGATSSLSKIIVRRNAITTVGTYGIASTCGAQGSNILVERNTVKGAGLRGIRTTNSMTIRANVIGGQTYGIEVVGSSAPVVLAYNNTLIGNERALRGDAAGASLTAKNNIIVSNTFSYSHSGVGTTFAASNNLVYNNGVSASYASVNDVTTAPNLDSDNRPSVLSPAIGAGTFQDFGPDMDGNPYRCPPTIGAYEKLTDRLVRI